MVMKIQNSKIVMNYISYTAAILAYVFMIIGFLFIIIPRLTNNNSSKILQAIRIGGLFGFVVYGIYNTTNLAIFKNYSIKTSIIDTLWGTFVFSFASYIYLLL